MAKTGAITLPKWDGVRKPMTPKERKKARAEAKEKWNALTKEQQAAIESAAYDEHCKAQYRRNPDSLSRHLLSSRPALSAEYEDWRNRHGIPGRAERMKASALKRYAAEVRQTPKWNIELDRFVWRELRSLRVDREKATGIKWAIDHVFPLQGRRVSGLHTALNWQLIPSWMNNEKLNRVILTRPDEWIFYLNEEWLPPELYRQTWRSSPLYDPFALD